MDNLQRINVHSVGGSGSWKVWGQEAASGEGVLADGDTLKYPEVPEGIT